MKLEPKPVKMELAVQRSIQLALSTCVTAKILMFSQDWNPGFSQGHNVTIKWGKQEKAHPEQYLEPRCSNIVASLPSPPLGSPTSPPTRYLRPLPSYHSHSLPTLGSWWANTSKNLCKCHLSACCLHGCAHMSECAGWVPYPLWRQVVVWEAWSLWFLGRCRELVFF